MRGHLEIDASRCTGCNSCVLTCAFAHEEAFSLSKGRLRINADPISAEYTPRVCVQCDDAACIDSCPTGALSVNWATGAIQLDRAACIGCQACVSACPYSGIFFDEVSRKPLICDLCDGNPQCVAVCQRPQAIRFIDRARKE